MSYCETTALETVRVILAMPPRMGGFGVEAAVILDGRVPHAMLLELFTPHGAVTLIRRDP